jgi:hypothetical protein
MAKYNITHKYLLSILDYNPKTGVFVWRERTPDMFEDGKHSKDHTCNKWNTRYSDKKAGWLNNKGYVCLVINNKKYLAHVLAYIYMVGKNPDKDIDHINRIRNDNRWINLRLSTQTQNNANSKIRCNNTSGYRGVTFEKRRNKWKAQIGLNGKTIFLGDFKTPEEAHAAYCKAARELFGEFAQ